MQKTLSDYTREANTKAFNDCGAFFAFSNEQLEEQKKDGVQYAAMGMGLVCPVDNCTTLKQRLADATAEGIKLDIADYGLRSIIVR